MLTDIEVCNKALLLVGAQTISTLADATDRARLMNVLYPQARKAVLRAHPWNCAVREVRLTAPGLMSPRDRASIASDYPIEVVGNVLKSASATTATGGMGIGNVGQDGLPGVRTGKYYFEAIVEVSSSPSVDIAVGVLALTAAVPDFSTYAKANLSTITLTHAKGIVYRADAQLANATALSAYGATYTRGDVIGIAVDLDTGNGSITFYKNGVTQGVAVAAINTSTLNHSLYPAIDTGISTRRQQVRARLQESEWTYMPPAEHVAWPSKSLTTEWPYTMSMPRDWLRSLFCSADQIAIDYKVMGTEIICDQPAIDLRYVRDMPDPSDWDAHVTDCVVYYLARELAYPITKSATFAAEKREEFKTILREAKTIDGTEDTPETPTDYPLIQARRFA